MAGADLFRLHFLGEQFLAHARTGELTQSRRHEKKRGRGNQLAEGLKHDSEQIWSGEVSHTRARSSSGCNLQRKAQSAAPQRLKQSEFRGLNGARVRLKATASAGRSTCGRLVARVLALTMLVAVAGSDKGAHCRRTGWHLVSKWQTMQGQEASRDTACLHGQSNATRIEQNTR
jgi:hypothetical protein